MKFARALLVASLFPFIVPAQAAAEEDGWQAAGHALTLVQMFVRIAARSDDPKAGLQAIDDVLAGRNTEANRALAGLLEETTSDMPAEQRARVAAIGRDLAALARKEVAKAPAEPVGIERTRSVESSLQARKDLTAMGLSYHDPKQYIEAVKRDDALAVELYVVGRGVNLSSRDADGRSALEIARANGNARIETLIARSLPAAR
jgi:hypothetical protein